MSQIIKSGALKIRDVDGDLGNPEEAFLYSSGWKGPGYIQMGLVFDERIMATASTLLAVLIAKKVPDLEVIASNEGYGMVLAWETRERVQAILGRPVHCVWVHDTRKLDRNMEGVANTLDDQEIHRGTRFIVGKEPVNFAAPTIDFATKLRSLGYEVSHVMCMFSSAKANKALGWADLELISLFTLPQLLDVAEQKGTHERALIDNYREFLKDPVIWNEERGFENPKLRRHRKKVQKT